MATKKKISPVVEKFKQHEKDTGSVEVQIVALTAGIAELQQHCEKNPKDFSSKRGLMQKVNQRRQFLDYIKHHNQNVHKELIKELGLRK